MLPSVDDAVTIILAHLAIGALIWALTDPVACMDSTIRAYVQRTGRVPGNVIIVLSFVAAIVLWPRPLFAVARVLWSTGR